MFIKYDDIQSNQFECRVQVRNQLLFLQYQPLMDTVRNVLMSYLVKMLVPESPAYGNSMPFVKEESLEEVVSSLQVGDIIFTKTNNSWYEVCRRLLNTEYDHVSVVINKNQVIHISPPIISKIDINSMIVSSRQPLILRLPLEQSQKQTMLSILLNFIGEKYNESAIPNMFKNEVLSRILSPQKEFQFSFQAMKYSKICTEAILYALGKAEPDLVESLEGFVHEKTGYHKLGYILPQEALKFLLDCDGQIVYKSPFHVQPTLLNKIEHGMQQISERMSVLTKLMSGMNSAKVQGMQIIKQLSNQSYKILLKEHPLLRILNIAFILFELKYGNKFNKLLLIYSVISTVMLFRIVPSEDAVKNVFKKLAKL